MDLRLEVGQVNEQVQVQALAVQLEGETSSLGQVITQQDVVQLPLSGRNFLQLANISPRVVPAYNARSATITNQSGRTDMAVHISGTEETRTAISSTAWKLAVPGSTPRALCYRGRDSGVQGRPQSLYG